MFCFPFPPNPHNIVVISDIPQLVSQGFIIKTLKTFGPMKLLLSQDLIRTSKQIGFVTYNHSNDANIAINALNHFELIEGFPINATKLRSSLGNSAILLEDLPNDVSIEEVDEALKKFGSIFCSKICRSENNEPLGYGYVDFESEKAAKACLSQKTPIIIKGKPLNLELYPEFGNQTDKIKKVLYIRNFGSVPEGKSEEEFVKDKKSEFLLTFSKPDSNILVASIEIKKNFSGKYFALIGYLSKDECDLIFRNFQKISDNPMIVCQLEERLLQETVIKTPPSTNASLYTKGLRKNIDNEKVQAVFSQFGTVISCRVTDPPNPKILTRQGFINFKNNEEASTALNDAKNSEDVKALYENGEVYLNWCNDLNNKKKPPQMAPPFYPPPMMMMYPPPPAIGGYFNRMQQIENLNLRQTGSVNPLEKKKEDQV